jgi:hypothetical protein
VDYAHFVPFTFTFTFTTLARSAYIKHNNRHPASNMTLKVMIGTYKETEYSAAT